MTATIEPNLLDVLSIPEFIQKIDDATLKHLSCVNKATRAISIKEIEKRTKEKDKTKLNLTYKESHKSLEIFMSQPNIMNSYLLSREGEGDLLFTTAACGNKEIFIYILEEYKKYPEKQKCMQLIYKLNYKFINKLIEKGYIELLKYLYNNAIKIVKEQKINELKNYLESSYLLVGGLRSLRYNPFITLNSNILIEHFNSNIINWIVNEIFPKQNSEGKPYDSNELNSNIHLYLKGNLLSILAYLNKNKIETLIQIVQKYLDECNKLIEGEPKIDFFQKIINFMNDLTIDEKAYAYKYADIETLKWLEQKGLNIRNIYTENDSIITIIIKDNLRNYNNDNNIYISDKKLFDMRSVKYLFTKNGANIQNYTIQIDEMDIQSKIMVITKFISTLYNYKNPDEIAIYLIDCLIYHFQTYSIHNKEEYINGLYSGYILLYRNIKIDTVKYIIEKLELSSQFTIDTINNDMYFNYKLKKINELIPNYIFHDPIEIKEFGVYFYEKVLIMSVLTNDEEQENEEQEMLIFNKMFKLNELDYITKEEVILLLMHYNRINIINNIIKENGVEIIDEQTVTNYLIGFNNETENESDNKYVHNEPFKYTKEILIFIIEKLNKDISPHIPHILLSSLIKCNIKTVEWICENYGEPLNRYKIVDSVIYEKYKTNKKTKTLKRCLYNSTLTLKWLISKEDITLLENIKSNKKLYTTNAFKYSNHFNLRAVLECINPTPKIAYTQYLNQSREFLRLNFNIIIEMFDISKVSREIKEEIIRKLKQRRSIQFNERNYQIILRQKIPEYDSIIEELQVKK